VWFSLKDNQRVEVNEYYILHCEFKNKKRGPYSVLYTYAKFFTLVNPPIRQFANARDLISIGN